jgi:hypothetical protein
MVFIFQPVVMSYLPMPRHTWNFERNRELGRRLEPLVERIVEGPVTPGWTRNLLLSGAIGLLMVGVISAFKIQVGYSHAGTPLYRSDAKVNTDPEVSGGRGLGATYHAVISARPVGAGPQRVAVGRPSAQLSAQ